MMTVDVVVVIVMAVVFVAVVEGIGMDVVAAFAVAGFNDGLCCYCCRCL